MSLTTGYNRVAKVEVVSGVRSMRVGRERDNHVKSVRVGNPAVTVT